MRGQICVLHVDDDEALADLVATYLERERSRLDVDTVHDARTALDRLAAASYDCVVSDYDMPGMDGVEFLRAVREDDPDLPFILFTGKGSEEVASDAVSAGVTEYMQKETGPDQFVVLANRVVNVATAYRTRRALADTRTRYRQLVEHAPNGILVVQAGRVRFGNATARRWRAGDVEGVRMERLVAPDCLREFRSAVRAAFGADEPSGWHTGRLHDDFDGRAVEYTAASVAYDGDDAVQVVLRDVTDREERERKLEALLAATRDVIHADDERAVCEVVADTAERVLDLPLAGVWRYDADADVLRPVVYPAASPAVPDDPPTFREDSLSWRAFRAGETRVHDDLRRADTHNRDTAVRSEVIVPIGDFGVLNSGSPEPATFDRSDVYLAEILAANAAAVLSVRRRR